MGTDVDGWIHKCVHRIAMRLQLLILFGVGAAVHGDGQSGTYVVEGQTTTVDDYPFMVNMMFLKRLVWRHRCSGVLLSVRAVLSSAHCYVDTDTAMWRARLGSSTKRNTMDYTIDQFVIYDDFNTPTPYNHDLAFVILEDDTVLSSSIGVARLPSTNTSSLSLPDNTPVTAISWSGQGNRSLSVTLKQAQVYTTSHSFCTQRYAELKTRPNFEDNPVVTSNMFCAGILDVDREDSCQGEPDGLLVYQGDIIIGISSWGYSCTNSTYPGVYTLFSNYIDWIKANI